jgi:DNA-binding Lrp family transcriptional regulator
MNNSCCIIIGVKEKLDDVSVYSMHLQKNGAYSAHCQYYNPLSLIGISVEPGTIYIVAETLGKLTEVSYLVLIFGAYNLVVEVFCRDREHLTNFITNQIQTIEGVRATETLVIGKIFK